MFAMLVTTSALLVAQDSPAATPADPAILNQLIERSREIKSFSATYRMIDSSSEHPGLFRFDYRAPDELRMDAGDDDGRTSTWVHGWVFDMRRSDEDGNFHTHLDFAGAWTDAAPIREAIERAFPTRKTWRKGAVLAFDWLFDRTSNTVDFSIETQYDEDCATPFGWLTTLKRKGTPPTEDADRLRYSTDDDRVEVVVSKKSGVLEHMIVRKPERTLTLELEKISIDEPIESARFDVPRVEADSRDVVGDSATQFERRIHMLLRRDAWHRAALACTDGSISGQLREKFASSMKPWHELVCHAQFDEWLTDSRPRIDEIVEYLRQKQKSGSSRDELDRIRSDQRSKLVAALDKLEASYTENLGVPELEAAAACAMQLLAVEREFAVNVFGELVRQPLLDEFDRATKTD